ncbi:tetratricopeptide repeat protein [Planktomarina sp.]|nr:tetratricopeptide repeat protein [Planktomarina sp.]
MIYKLKIKIIVALFGVCCFTPAVSQNISGSYLAARQAVVHHDYRIATEYYARALVQAPGNFGLLSQALSAFLAVGEFNKALSIANLLETSGNDLPLANFVMLTADFKSGEYEQALARLSAGSVAGPAIDGLFEAWALMGLGKVGAALVKFDDIAAMEGTHSFAGYQKALALALVGDFESAEELFAGAQKSPISVNARGSFARAQILVQLDQNAKASAYLKKIHGVQGDPRSVAMRARFDAGANVGFDIVTSAAAGAGEVLFSFAEALRDGNAQDGLLLYARMANYLQPRNVDTILLTAHLLEDLGSYELANEAYNKVPRSHPYFVTAELGRADTLFQLEDTNSAIEVLSQLAQSFPNVRDVQESLGNARRQNGEYSEALTAYDAAISLIDIPKIQDWYTYYVRAIAHERSGNWPAAERDFQGALALSSNQFQVLNYLGYSLVERGERLDEALSMISRAAIEKPDSGYIIDSLGWVQFRLGQYSEAVINMERATELMATDPIVNDHLGDAYWAVGRKVEARFQWRRSLSFITSKTDLNDIDPGRIERKLDVGLDQVLIDEGLAPLINSDGN